MHFTPENRKAPLTGSLKFSTSGLLLQDSRAGQPGRGSVNFMVPPRNTTLSRAKLATDFPSRR